MGTETLEMGTETLEMGTKLEVYNLVFLCKKLRYGKNNRSGGRSCL